MHSPIPFPLLFLNFGSGLKTPLPFERFSIADIVLSDTKIRGKADFPGRGQAFQYAGWIALHSTSGGEYLRTDRDIFRGRGRVERDEREKRTVPSCPSFPFSWRQGKIFIFFHRGPGIVPRGILIRSTISDIQCRSKVLIYSTVRKYFN